MPWYGYSLVAMLANSWYSISQKWALNLGINRTKLLTYIFIGLFFGYLGDNLLTDSTGFLNQIQSPQFFLLGLLAAVFSLAGNIAQIKALKQSPNPGYVQAVIVTNALVVAIISVLILGSTIKVIKTLGILVIIVGLFLLLFEKGKKKTAGWQAPAILAAVSYGLMALVVKRMTNLEITPVQVLASLTFFVSIGLLTIAWREKVNLGFKDTPRSLALPIMVAAVIAFSTNLLQFTAIKFSSNPGYPVAIFNSSVVFTLLFSGLIFPKESGGEFNPKKWLGVVVTIIGVIIVILG